jgi:hypothetical protein
MIIFEPPLPTWDTNTNTNTNTRPWHRHELMRCPLRGTSNRAGGPAERMEGASPVRGRSRAGAGPGDDNATNCHSRECPR